MPALALKPTEVIPPELAEVFAGFGIQFFPDIGPVGLVRLAADAHGVGDFPDRVSLGQLARDTALARAQRSDRSRGMNTTLRPVHGSISKCGNFFQMAGRPAGFFRAKNTWPPKRIRQREQAARGIVFSPGVRLWLFPPHGPHG